MTIAPKAAPDAAGRDGSRDRTPVSLVELAIRLGALGVLLYVAYQLVSPFVTIAIWSAVLAVALYPVFERMAHLLGGRRRLAAALLTVVSLLVVVGPATWLAVGLIESLRVISQELDITALPLPPPSPMVREWPLIGERLYQFWDLATTNLKAALAEIAPQLKPLGSSLLSIAANTGVNIVMFLLAIVVAGFLFVPGPTLVAAVKRLARRLVSHRGEEFVRLAGATIRAVSRGVIGISVLQALLAGIGLMAAGVPGTSLLTTAILVLGIVQIGPSIVIIPLIIWSWFTFDTTAAVLFTVYMVPVNLVDNVLRPIVMGHGLKTPMLVILIGVLGGTLAYGISGLFLGPIVLAVIWELLVAWTRDAPAEAGGAGGIADA